jgi:hypothetical protein
MTKLVIRGLAFILIVKRSEFVLGILYFIVQDSVFRIHAGILQLNSHCLQPITGSWQLFTSQQIASVLSEPGYGSFLYLGEAHVLYTPSVFLQRDVVIFSIHTRSVFGT